MRQTREQSIANFWDTVIKTDYCWVWMGYSNRGYGVRKVVGFTTQQAHRISYEMTVGPIPEGLVLDHLCRNPPCVNPAHLEPVTQAENVLRGTAPSAQQATSTKCPSGHPRSGRYLYITSNGWRACRECIRINKYNEYQRKKKPCLDCGTLVHEKAVLGRCVGCKVKLRKLAKEECK